MPKTKHSAYTLHTQLKSVEDIEAYLKDVPQTQRGLAALKLLREAHRQVKLFPGMRSSVQMQDHAFALGLYIGFNADRCGEETEDGSKRRRIAIR